MKVLNASETFLETSIIEEETWNLRLSCDRIQQRLKEENPELAWSDFPCLCVWVCLSQQDECSYSGTRWETSAVGLSRPSLFPTGSSALNLLALSPEVRGRRWTYACLCLELRGEGRRGEEWRRGKDGRGGEKRGGEDRREEMRGEGIRNLPPASCQMIYTESLSLTAIPACTRTQLEHRWLCGNNSSAFRTKRDRMRERKKKHKDQ